MNKSILNNEYKISIIMPVYNTEEYFDRCIRSVLNQSYINLELIVVDDCSPGNIKEKVTLYAEKDQRVKMISHEKNEGLFKARLTGAKAATGDYIAFIDSDDYVSMDYYHTLLDKAVTEQVDITIGRTVHQDQNGNKFIYNLHDAGFHFDRLEGDEVRKRFYCQKGQCYAWHTIWNKLYTKKLWDQCTPYYDRIDRHVIMTEDIAFSSVLFFFAHSVATTANDAYFYCANDKASTNADHITMKKFVKNLEDISTVFDFVKQFLEEQNAPESINTDFLEFRKLYARLWNNIPKYQLSAADAIKGSKIMKEFCPDETSCAHKDDYFFSSIQTKWTGGLENIKERILKSQDKYISFDIFDTLIKRPFLDPADLFELIDREFEQLMPSSLKFRNIRTEAEVIARRKFGSTNPEWEDITIYEIYQVMGEMYHIPADLIKRLLEREKELEIEFCGVRNAGRELYETALLSGKQILIISDMYLDKETIIKILDKNGYREYSYLYVSSEVRLTKNRGNLYKYVCQELKIDQTMHVYHIGDAWQNDYINSEKNGFEPILLPKAREIFENRIQGVNTNQCGTIGINSNGNIVDKQKQYRSIGLSCMYSVVCNMYFDNPYRAFNPESDFNADPYFIGLYALGMHLIGLSKWISGVCKDKEVKRVHFLARDGYMPMRAFEILNSNADCISEFDYMYASRKSVMPGMIKSTTDFYNLPVEYRNHSPKTLLKVLEFASADLSEEIKEDICKSKKISYQKTFAQREDYLRFIDIFLDKIYDEERYKESYSLAKEYYSQISEKDLTFDMGYSGRIQNAISELCGRSVDALFVHSDNDMSAKMSRMGKFDIINYYDFIPCVSGLLREHMLSDYHDGCVGFQRVRGKVEPILKSEEKSSQDIIVIDMIQKGALDFVTYMRNYFGEYWDYIPFRYTETSMPFEGYLKNAKDIDRKIFAASYFEDFVYGASEKINIEQFIRDYYGNANVINEKDENTELFFTQCIKNKGKISRALIFFILNKDVFSKKMANELRGRPILYRFGKWAWNLLKKKEK